MRYQIIHWDANNKITIKNANISLPAFAKHAAFAGLNDLNFWMNPYRNISLLFEFIPSFLWSDSFMKYPGLENDPTETAQMSNKIGRAFADFFSKKIYGAKFTHSYECAMFEAGYDLIDERPDFYCDTGTQQFAVEAKGFSRKSISNSEMIDHIDQANTGPLSTHFSVASVAYNLYESPKINFYDPKGETFSYNYNLNSHLRDLYYRKVLLMIEIMTNNKGRNVNDNYLSFELPLYNLVLRNDLYIRNSSRSLYPTIHIIVDKEILEGKFNDPEWLTKPVLKTWKGNERRIYIDADGIGVAIGERIEL